MKQKSRTKKDMNMKLLKIVKKSEFEVDVSKKYTNNNKYLKIIYFLLFIILIVRFLKLSILINNNIDFLR